VNLSAYELRVMLRKAYKGELRVIFRNLTLNDKPSEYEAVIRAGIHKADAICSAFELVIAERQKGG
jgi:hypothetical protein